MVSGALTGGYEETLALGLAEEWIYLTWAREVEPMSTTRRTHYDEWISHHTDQWLVDWVDWLRSELDRNGPDLSPRSQARAARLFERTAALEGAFFDEALSKVE
jgi:thiaminase/transcriptional activator TenA